jgi:hypothetical protein
MNSDNKETNTPITPLPELTEQIPVVDANQNVSVKELPNDPNAVGKTTTIPIVDPNTNQPVANTTDNVINKEPVPAPEVKPEEVPQPVAPAPEVKPVEAPQPAAPTPEVKPVEAPQPVAPTPEVQPVEAPQPVAPAPAPQPVAPTPVQEVPVQPAPAPVAPAPVQQPVAQPAPVQPVAPVQPTPQVVQPVQPVVQPVQPVTEAPTIPVGNGTPTPGIVSQDQTNVGFISNGTVIKKKLDKRLIAVIVVAAITLVGLLGYFVIFPLVMDKLINKPIRVYQTAVTELKTKANNIANEVLHKSMLLEANLTIDTNMESFKQLTGYTYGFKYGIDPGTKSIEKGYSIVSSKDIEVSSYNYLKDDNFYKRLSNYRDLIYLGDDKSIGSRNVFGSYPDTLEHYSILTNGLVNNIIDTTFDTIYNSLDESKITKEDASISINNTTLKVHRNKYVLSKDDINNILDTIKEKIKDNKDIMKNLENLYGMNTTEVENLIDSISLKDMESSEVTISIFTMGNFNTYIGFEIVTDKKYEFHNYSYKGLSDIKLVYPNGDTTVTTYTVNSEQANSKVRYIIKKDDQEFLQLTVASWTEYNIDLDYTYTIDKKTSRTGSFKFVRDVSTQEKNNYNATLSIKSGNEYITLSADIINNYTATVSNINAKAASTLSEADLYNAESGYTNVLLQVPLGNILIGTLSGTNSGVDISTSLQTIFTSLSETQKEQQRRQDENSTDLDGTDEIDERISENNENNQTQVEENTQTENTPTDNTNTESTDTIEQNN